MRAEARHLRPQGQARLKREFEKRSYIEKYIPHIGIALQEILDLTDRERDPAPWTTLEDVLHKLAQVLRSSTMAKKKKATQEGDQGRAQAPPSGRRPR